MDDMLGAAVEQERADGNVVAAFPQHVVTPLRRAVASLFPSRNPAKANRYVGSHQAIYELLGARVSIGVIRQYLYGRRPTPRWIRAIVQDQLLHRVHVYSELAAELEAEPDGPGRGLGLRRYLAERRAHGVALRRGFAEIERLDQPRRIEAKNEHGQSGGPSVSLHAATGLGTALKIMALLDEAWTAHNWNISLLKIREARHHLEQLMMLLNSTVPGVKARDI